MIIELKEFSISEVVENYSNNDEEGVFGFGGLLNIRPKYQREFIYDDDKRNAVIETITKGFPLNVMYWVSNDDGTYEILDGQQRTMSFCEYVAGNFSVEYRYFHNLTESEKEDFLNYKLMIYVCKGTDKEKLDWFRVINIAGEKLTDQELKNAVYAGSWTIDAKRHFSKSNCAAYNLGKKYLKGKAIRQDYLETALKWFTNDNVEEYMSQHQHDQNANELWLYFQNVIQWVKATIPHYRKEMKGINWGYLFNEYGTESKDISQLEETISRLMADDEVDSKTGIYYYIFDGKEKNLHLRKFTDTQKRTAYEQANGICAHCGRYFEIDETEADHITPWHLGGKTEMNNCQILCKDCNRAKGGN